MKLSDHVDLIRSLVHKSFNNQFARLGFGANKMLEADKIPAEFQSKRKKIEELINSHEGETGTYEEAREKALDELTFTLFNRLSALKVMEAHQLFSPIVTKQAMHGDRSFGHKIWLENNPKQRDEELEGLRNYFKFEFNKLGEAIPLFHKKYPYALLPYVIEFNEIIDAFNAVEQDAQIDDLIWQSDDILGWLYESYNNVKKQAHKDSGEKTEFDKVSLQSQVYTPRWVVEFLVHNSLGKLYLEMYPDSEIKDLYKIANAPKTREREIKPLHELKLIDPASGSGNFLLYAFVFFYALYKDQIDNYGADYEENDIPKLIIENNLHGIDLDDRAIQLAQLGLWIKAKQKNRTIGTLNFNVVSSDFYLPDFDFVYPIFKAGVTDTKQLSVIEEIWIDLQQAYKFGSLVKIEEKLSIKLHGLINADNVTLFDEQTVAEYERFKEAFFKNLETAIAQYATQAGSSFLTDKTKDAITFLKLLTTKYDVATANPPYTDSADFGPNLKTYIDENYLKPYRFSSNLYASFIKRCCELTNAQGKVAMIHPHTFMFIKSFEEVRQYMIDKLHIDVMIDFGLDRVNLFGPGILLDATFYVLSKNKSETKGLYFNLTTNLQEKYKKEKFLEALGDYISEKSNPRIYELEQSKLKIIKSYPFIYWISNDFREKFKLPPLEELFDICNGISSGGNNERFYRFWWEVDVNDILSDTNQKDYKWTIINKGGPHKKWYGNLWLVFKWEDNGKELKSLKSKFPSIRHSFEENYFRKGLAFSGSSSKGLSVRYQPEYCIFERSGKSIFSKEDDDEDYYYLLALLNSKIIYFITGCLNPTVSLQTGDINRIPFVQILGNDLTLIKALSLNSLSIVERFSSYNIYETTYGKSPICDNLKMPIARQIKEYFSLENYLFSVVLVNEFIINEKIFEVYELTSADKAMVLAKEGESIGGLPVLTVAKKEFLENEITEFPLDNIKNYIENLPEKEFTASEREAIENEFPALYQSNNDLEEFCTRHQVNPINVWYWFKESNVIPKQRMNTLAMEFLADMIREILMEDDDGIIPLVPNAGEKVLLDRIEEKFIEKGFSMAQYSSFDGVLGRNIKDYINGHFFKALSDHLNLFMYLPKTPFIWHLTSGPEQGFDCYIIIYKWNRDKLLRIRSVYIENRERALSNRQSDLRAKELLSAAEQNEADKIYKQLQEIEVFKTKIDALLEEGYNPILDDGVGKNIAPLQKKGMLAYEVLNAGQLKKYLNADW